MEISFSDARKKLTLIWAILGGIIIIIVFLQTITGRYNEIKQQAWEWFLPNVLPNITLVITTQFGDNTKRKNLKIDKFFYYISLALSIIYLLILIVIIFSYSDNKGNILEYYKSYNILLTSIQSLVTASLGLFFINKK